ncbi:MAG: exopolysaccharide biosynthesis protein [Gammaproteobacteria bacterium]|uniref:exopolysaccharide biosynthesis protein n=1 Tax=Rhodoferax sp. TaxID=50421 RepID=UPI0017DD1C71|nr:exopolysaccharide biosynthesis protein [Rhodoferax sp.]MBU3900218.1 exopolysaccharide biosynthesis protein [Gammaproteobacteria bacterium]MBA3058796.1 exopolysaccharide biosynthesis protein [Rhodoferax sp.]MBU3999542.1 exopolysaccharide biosynthesis protein [Gammaproteobacteria bacterium]MBU4082282.1 exopolysaccharide biosynthesis protein [Gammaproteobacteria bacterium]MBU4114155.1 exopolysaccharide biosynthesis protein [Gammaproteobacteria bacterium]
MATHLAAVFAQAAAATRSDATPVPGPETDALTVNLHELLRLHGETSTAVVLMLLSVATVLPVAGVGSVLSLAIFALAWRWARQQETTTLPQRVGGLTLNARWTRRCLHALAWIYRQANLWLKPRWQALTHDRARPGWALWIALMGFVIFLPIPFGNVLPSLSLVCLSLGWMFRDGLALVFSALLGVSALALMATFSQLLWQMLQPLTAWLPLLA